MDPNDFKGLFTGVTVSYLKLCEFFIVLKSFTEIAAHWLEMNQSKHKGLRAVYKTMAESHM